MFCLLNLDKIKIMIGFKHLQKHNFVCCARYLFIFFLLVLLFQTYCIFKIINYFTSIEKAKVIRY